MKPGYEQYKQATKQLKSGFLKLGLELATLKLSGSATKDGGGNRKMRVRSRSKQVLVTGRSSLAGGWTAAGPPCCELCEWRTHGMPSASPPSPCPGLESPICTDGLSSKHVAVAL